MSLGMLAAIVSVAGEIPYIRSIMRGHVRPERASWGIWTLILIVAVWSYEASGAEDSLWFIVGELIGCSIIFLLSLWRGVGGFVRRDIVCTAIAVAGVIVWQLTDQPGVAILAVIIADMAGVYPTLVKSLNDPWSERAITFVTSAVAAALGILAVAEWDAALLGYPVYLFLANVVIAMVILIGQHHVSRYSKS